MSLQLVESTAPRRQATEPVPAIAQDSYRLTWIRLKFALAAAFIAGLALSPKLWMGQRYFPHIPVVPELPPLPAPLDAIVYGLMLFALVMIAVRPQVTRWIALFVGLIAVMAVSDQMRWQPWAYQYLWMLGAVGLGAGFAKNQDAKGQPDYALAVNAVRLVVACTYFWSGVQKMNAAFTTGIFPYLMEPFARYLPVGLMQVIGMGAVAVPVVEASIGIGLLFPRTRKWAAAAAIGMHCFILLSIGPLGRNYNSVVWPWNIAMMAFGVILFLSPAAKLIGPREILWPKTKVWFPKLALVIVGFVPALSLVNLWDSYLSFALYSGFVNDARIEMSNAFADRLPKPVLYHVFLTNKPGTTKMFLHEWAMDELNVPVNPEPRVYKGIGHYFCALEKKPGEVKFYIYELHSIVANRKLEYDCASLVGN